LLVLANAREAKKVLQEPFLIFGLMGVLLMLTHNQLMGFVYDGIS
jgi:hypothetical protein